jgi:hypothetical protein
MWSVHGGDRDPAAKAATARLTHDQKFTTAIFPSQSPPRSARGRIPDASASVGRRRRAPRFRRRLTTAVVTPCIQGAASPTCSVNNGLRELSLIEPRPIAVSAEARRVATIMICRIGVADDRVAEGLLVCSGSGPSPRHWVPGRRTRTPSMHSGRPKLAGRRTAAGLARQRVNASAILDVELPMTAHGSRGGCQCRRVHTPSSR